MNGIQYRLENYFFEKSGSQKEDLKKFSMDQYVWLSSISFFRTGMELPFTALEFEKLLTEIYEVLKLKLTSTEFYKVIYHYIYLLSMDCQKDSIDLLSCFDNLYYLVTYPEKAIVQKFDGDILYIQNRLYEEFEVQENLLEKTYRKIRTYGLQNIGK